MKKNPWLVIGLLLASFAGLVLVTLALSRFMPGMDGMSNQSSFQVVTSSDNILHVKLEGIILNPEKFFEAVKKIRKVKVG
jgi:hypothetical protein